MANHNLQLFRYYPKLIAIIQTQFRIYRSPIIQNYPNFPPKKELGANDH